MQEFMVDIICIWLYMLVTDEVHVRFLVPNKQYIYQKMYYYLMEQYTGGGRFAPKGGSFAPFV